jgi:4-hydroxy-tetrahydrodipicolinate reductase
MDMDPTDVVILGWGPIGRRIGARVLLRPGTLRLVGIVDNAPAIVGKAVGTEDGTGHPNLIVRADCPTPSRKGGVLVQATTSDYRLALEQVSEAVALGWNVVSTCEEMTSPKDLDSESALAVDAAARDQGVSVLAAGINPGFVMDILPVALSTMCTDVEAIKVVRVVDTNLRREQLQRKAGVSMKVEEFRELALGSRIGHVGLRQSAQLIADRMGWSLDSVHVSLDPVVAKASTQTGLGIVEGGRVIGQHQVAVATCQGQEVIRLDLEMSAGANSTDEVWISGDPEIHQIIEGGVNGDIGTEAVIANLILQVAKARPGLLSMADLVPIGCYVGPRGTKIPKPTAA